MPSPAATRLIIGCGYLGRRVARQWVDAGDHVVALTRSSAHASELAEQGIRPLIGDVLDAATLCDLPAAKTVLYAVGFDRSSDFSKREVYVDGPRNVLAVLPQGIERFIYISSTSVYGQSRGEWIDETSPCDPQTDGGHICLDAEQLVRSTLNNRAPLHVLRLSGIYGPGRLIARIDALRQRRPLSGDPDGWLNLIHVDDAATAVIACAESSQTPDTLLVSDDRPVQRRTYYDTLAKLVGTPAPQYETVNSSSSSIGKRCSNRRLHESLGVTLAFPTILEGLPHAAGDPPEGLGFQSRAR